MLRKTLGQEKEKTAAQLVLAGGNGWQNEEIYQAARESRYGNDIIFTGYLTNEEKNCLYRHAALFVFPSLYEGFGMPPLEAMHWGCPVVTANTASLPEVCGDAAELVDPFKIESIANGSYDSPEEVRSFLEKRLITLMPLCYLLSFRQIILERYEALKILTALPFDLIPSYTMFNFYDFGKGRGFWFIANILIAYALFPVLIKPIRRLRCVDAALLLTALYLLRCTMENIQEVFGGGPYYLYSIPLPRLMEFFMGTLLYRVASEWPVKNEGKMRRALLRLAVPVLLALVVFLTDAWADYLEIYRKKRSRRLSTASQTTEKI